MKQINIVLLVGHLVRDPERKVTQTGSSLGVFTVASNQRYTDQNGQKREEVAFVPCIIFGPPAEWLFEHGKGTMVIVNGRLRTESWEGSDGVESKLVLVADTLQFVQSVKRSAPKAPLPTLVGAENGDRDQVPF